jgi:A/G-specific adenine glycosylase
MNKQRFNNNLLDWYDRSKRILPWRDDPMPYKVWVSEIMLQQTRVQAVIPFFNRFIGELPTIQHLAKANDDLLHKLWEGLGYYNRVKNLKKAAIIVVEKHNGILPNTYEELLSLPGIGEYTAGAVLSIAFNQRYTAVDGNVLRVFARILGIRDDIKDPPIKKRIKLEVNDIIPKKRIGDYNQALMEIGATVCLPYGVPKCEICPLKESCRAFKKDLQGLIPAKRKSKKVPVIDKTVVVIKYQNTYAIEQRPNTGLLAGLYQFPTFDGHLTKQEIHNLMLHENISDIIELRKSKHIFSHKHWNMIGYLLHTEEKSDKYQYYTKNEIEQYYAIPIAFKEYKKIL